MDKSTNLVSPKEFGIHCGFSPNKGWVLAKDWMNRYKLPQERYGGHSYIKLDEAKAILRQEYACGEGDLRPELRKAVEFLDRKTQHVETPPIAAHSTHTDLVRNYMSRIEATFNDKIGLTLLVNEMVNEMINQR